MAQAKSTSYLAHFCAVVGVSCVFNQIMRQTPDKFKYEGSMNAANVHIIFVWLLFAACSAVWLNKEGTSRFFGARKWGALVYPLLGMSTVFVTGMFGSYTSRHGWVDFSYANINAIRVAWEGSSGAPELLQAFDRSEALEALGLVDRYMPCEESSTDDLRENFQIAFIGALFLWIGGSILGSGMNGMPFSGAQAKAAGEDKMSASFGLQSFFGVLGFLFAMVSTFVIWSSDAAADPTHPFYEFVMQVAAVSLVSGTLGVVGTVMEQRYALEFNLYLAGFFLLTAPVKLFQILAFAETPEVRAEMKSFGYTDSNGMPTSSIITAELDRYSVAVVFNFLMGLTAVYSGIKAFQAKGADEKTVHNVEVYESVAYSAEAGGSRKKDIMHYVFLALSFVLVLAGAAQSWYVVGNVLEQFDAEKSYRNDGAAFYILLMLVAWLGFAVQYFERSLPSLKPLWWVAAGIGMSTFLGFNCVGVHDRQLWMIDYSLMGINELRAYMNYDDKTVLTKRAVGVEEKDYEAALGGDLCIWMGLYLAYMVGMKLPFRTLPFSSKTLWVSPTLADGSTAWVRLGAGAAWAFAGLVFGIIGFFVLLSTDLAGPSIHSATDAIPVECEAGPAAGDSFNLFLNAREAGCVENVSAANGERFTLDVTTSWVPTDRKYWEIYMFSLLALNSNIALFWGYFSGCLRSVKFALIQTAFLMTCLALPLQWDMTGKNTDDVWGSRLSFGDYGCESKLECAEYKAGFVFYFFSSICVMVAGTIIVGEIVTSVEGVQAIVEAPKPAEDLRIIMQQLTPEKQAEMVEYAKKMEAENSPTSGNASTNV